MSLSKIDPKFIQQYLAKKRIELENEISLSVREEDPESYPSASLCERMQILLFYQ